MKALSAVCVIAVLAASSSNGFAADSFDQSTRPLLRDYCVTCHSTEKQEGELDLERFISLEQVKRHADVWEQVQEQLALGEMPPKDAKQLSAEQRRLLTGWVRSTLNEIALANSGDPGPVVLRRLSNYEYTYSLRDLTGVPSLDPAREFPVDGAAGEGFTNVGSALVMSPALLSKYLEAAKDVASHMVLTPTGIRFSAGTSSHDATNETLARIRAFYAKHTGSGESSQTVAQGIKLDTGTGSGRLPLARYLDALQGRGSVEGLSPKYLGILRDALAGAQPSTLLDPLRAKFKAKQLTAADIEPWQKTLWRFSNVGHLGKVGGPKSWLEPVTPLATQHELRMKLQPPPDGSDLTLCFSTSDAGDGDVNDVALWDNARLITPGRGELLLRDVRSVLLQMERHRSAVGESAVRCLAAAHEAESAEGKPDLAALAQKHNVDAKVLAGWLTHLGIGGAGGLKLEPLLVKKTQSVANYDFIKGWAGV